MSEGHRASLFLSVSLATCMCWLQSADLPNLVPFEHIRRTCQAIDGGCLPVLAKKIEQSYPNYPLGSGDQSSVDCFRSLPSLRLAAVHTSSRQALLPSPLAFPSLFR